MNDVWKLLVLISLGAGCAAQRPEPAAPSGSGRATTVAAQEPAPASATPEEEAARAEQVAELQQKREQMLAEHRLELQRFTPELRAQAKALAERSYADARAALQAVVKSPHRKPNNVARDRYRHPQQTLEFLGLEPDLTVLEFAPGEGWYTELLAPALAKQGKLLVTSTDPHGPPEQLDTFDGQRFKAFLETSPELYSKVEVVTIDPARPALPEGTKLDMVLLLRGMDGLANDGTLGAWLSAFHKALKRRGVLGIEQHRADAASDPRESAPQGYLPEPWVIARVQAAGFKLVASSEINANPRDTKDHPEGVWTLPPTYRLGDQDRDKYAAIGESDRMTLRFIKVEEPAPMSPFVP
jgi:predicted methyltransferase